MTKIITITSGYFDPLHEGHIEYLRLARQLGDTLIVIVNTDKQALVKKGYSFMSQEARLEIIRSVRYVDAALLSIDEDKSVSKTLAWLAEKHKGDTIIFAKGGDRFTEEIPEAYTCKFHGIKIVDGLGEKIRSSSQLIEITKKPVKTEREWGAYEVLEETPSYKIKRLVVNTGKKLSCQMHYHRSEHWTVVHGTAYVYIDLKPTLLMTGESIYVGAGIKHRLENPSQCIPLEVIEIQLGQYFNEDDIVRFD